MAKLEKAIEPRMKTNGHGCLFACHDETDYLPFLSVFIRVDLWQKFF
ncbi:hypothetical protein [Ferrigenium sp. UT5]